MTDVCGWCGYDTIETHAQCVVCNGTGDVCTGCTVCPTCVGLAVSYAMTRCDVDGCGLNRDGICAGDLTLHCTEQ